jgi:hypothetical protein
MAAYEIYIDANPDPQTTGITILAELTGGEASGIRATLKQAYEDQAILDYGVDHMPGLVSASEAKRKVYEIIGRAAARNGAK